MMFNEVDVSKDKYTELLKRYEDLNEEKKSRRYYRDERGYTYYIGSDGKRYYE